MGKVTFQKNDEGTRLLAVFCDELHCLGRRFSVIEEETMWTVRLES